jgi:hypothetical protein
MLADPDAMVIETVRDELAVAVGVYVPETIGEIGDVEVFVMLWEPAPTVTVIVVVAML